MFVYKLQGSRCEVTEINSRGLGATSSNDKERPGLGVMEGKQNLMKWIVLVNKKRRCRSTHENMRATSMKSIVLA